MIFGERELARRRVALVERSAALRRTLAATGAPLLDKAAIADRLITTARAWLPRLTAAITLYAFLKRRRQPEPLTSRAR